jgi:MraZ protein
MYQGAAALHLDAKGRLAIPARHREALDRACQGNLVLTVHPHRCLLIYPAPAWVPIRDAVLAAPSLDTQAALVKRLLVGYAREEQIDAAGRILVAPELRRLVQLDKEVWLVGQGSHFELWSDAGWMNQHEQAFALGEKLLPAGMEGLVL